MKKYLFVLLHLSVSFLQAQDYKISFAGTGESASVGSVTVENLTQGTSLTLSGTEILHLVGTSTGLNPNLYDVVKTLHIYPNPMTENSIVEFVATAPGMTNIELFDITGKRIAVTQNRLTIAKHSYKVSGLQTGIYTIRINSDTYNYTGKLVSNGSIGKEARISYIGNNAIQVTTQKLKSATAEKTMQYTNGDLLKITGNTGKYTTIMMDVPTGNKTLTFNFIACTDADGNYYPVVKIGDQWWMAENLKTTSYKDGGPILLVPDYNTWKDLKTPGYCWFNNDTFYKNTYGALYNWHAVNTGKLAPTGWHVPSDAEWTVLTTFLGYEDIAGGKMKETGTTHWKAYKIVATNSSGFTGLPGGYRDYNGLYKDLADRAVYWSTSDANTGDAWLRELHSSFNYVNRFDWYQVHGYSVRCIKNDINYPAEPIVTTAAATNISQIAATSGGNVTSQGSSAITARGVCWSTSANPIILGFHTSEGSGSGSFKSNITGLISSTLYYFRAYATNSVCTSYGNEESFTTSTGSGYTCNIPPIIPGDTGIEVKNLQECLLFLLDKNIFKAYQQPDRPTVDELNQWKELLNKEKESVLFGEGTRQLVFTFQLQQGLGDNLMGVVEETTAAKLNETLKELGAIPMYVVFGSVVNVDLTPATGLTIIAYDTDITGELKLGKATTDPSGNYSIIYPEYKFRHSPSEIGGPNLFMRVYSASGTILVQSKTVVNAPIEQILDVILP